MVGRLIAWFFGLAVSFAQALITGIVRALTGRSPPEDSDKPALEDPDADQKDTETG